MALYVKKPISADAVFAKRGWKEEPCQTFHFCRINCEEVSPLPHPHPTSTWLKISSDSLARLLVGSSVLTSLLWKEAGVVRKNLSLSAHSLGRRCSGIFPLSAMKEQVS